MLEQWRCWEKNDGVFRIGSDLLCPRDTILLPGETVTLAADMPEGSFWPEPLADSHSARFDLFMPSQRENAIPSVRSRLALAGAHMELAGVSCALGPFQIEEKPVAFLTTSVLGGRPIRIAKGEGLACLFWTNNAPPLYGQDLVRSAQDGAFKIDGNLGEDWFYTVVGDSIKLVSDPELAQRSAVAIAVKLDQQRWFIPDSPEPIDPGVEGSYRDYLFRDVYHPVPSGTHVPFYVCGTRVAVHLPHGINAILNMMVKIGESSAMQTRSTLIMGGKTDWPILCEVYCPLGQLDERVIIVPPTPRDYEDQYVFFHLFQDRQ